MDNKNKEKIITKKEIKNEIIIHSIISIILLFICGWDRIINIPKFPKNFLFLTQICLYSNMIYYLFGLYKNMIQQVTISKNSKFLLLFNFNFSVSFVVFIMYWSMLFLDKATLYKKETKIKVPASLNILLHGGIFTTNIFNILFSNTEKKYIYIKIIFYLFFTIFYISALYISKIIFGIKIYPFIYGNTLKFLLISITSFIICLIGHFIYVFITKQKEEKKNEKNYEEFELEKTI